jgi:hypothetical protein
MINGVRVRNLENNKGNTIPNQFIITTGDSKYFQSYESIIIQWKDGKIYLDSGSWDYSVTTGKYRNQLLSETKKETEKKIKNGTYILKNLNA